MIATEPVTKATLRTPAAAERQAQGQKARDRYIEIAAALKAEGPYAAHPKFWVPFVVVGEGAASR